MENIFSDKVKNDIITNLLEPNFKNEIKSNLELKKFFKKLGLTFETLSKLFVGISSIVSFASGIYKYEVLSFLAGTTSVISLVLLQYSSYSYRESKKLNAEVHNSLTKLNISFDQSPDQGSDQGTITTEDTGTPFSPTDLKEVKIK
jgi:hypothetical protein